MTTGKNMGFAEEMVSIAGPDFPLAGTLTRPNVRGKSPAILIIPGSGNSDRDGKNKKFADMAMYKDLANFLTQLGYITLRYDKRGVGQSGGNFHESGFWDLVNDAIACVQFLKGHPAVDGEKIIILGHSEGCYIAPPVNARVPVDGMILLSGSCESAKDAFPRQREMLIEELRKLRGFKGFLVRTLHVVEKANKKQDKVMAKILNSTTPVIRVSGVKVNAKWMREHYHYDVIPDIQVITCPTLAITGSKDIQVIPEHAKRFAELVAGESEWHIIPNMTHILRTTEEQVKPLELLKLYKRISHQPPAPELLGLMQDWLGRHFEMVKTDGPPNVSNTHEPSGVTVH